MMKRNTRRDSDAFTLVEVLFAAALISLIMMILFTLLPSGVLMARRGAHNLKAVCIAQALLEEKRSGPYNDLYALPTDFSDKTGEDGTVYHPHDYEVLAVKDADPEVVKTLRIHVTWKEKDKEYTVFQELYVTKVK